MPQPSANQPRRSWSTYFSPPLIATLAVLWMLIAGLGSDVNAWKLAQAERYRSEPAKALTYVDDVLATDPDNIAALKKRIEYSMELGDNQAAIRTASAALTIPTLSADDRVAILQRRADLRQQLGEHIEAIRDANEALAVVDGSAPLDEKAKQVVLIQPRNMRAYLIARAAVAGKANRPLIESAQRDMQQVFLGLQQLRKRVTADDAQQTLALWNYEAQYLDTSAYLSLAAGDLPTALRDFSRVLQLLDSMELKLHREAASLPRELLDMYRASLRNTRAVVMHHRGEVLLAMGNQEQGAVSIALAKRLGYNPARGNW